MQERPVECTGCKRKANVLYKKVVEGKVECLRMCSACPHLQARIGQIASDVTLNGVSSCPQCGTTAHEAMVDGVLGCETCYDVFASILTQQLQEGHATPVHVGNSPELLNSETINKKIESLQLALSEALSTENYEQAATLRDQIKRLTESPYGKQAS